MNDTLERIKRLRDHGKRMARLELVRAETERSAQHRRLQQIEDRLHSARNRVDGRCADDMARYHNFRMRMEVVGRRQEHALEQARLRVEDRRSAVSTAAREAEVIRTLLDRRIEESRQDRARHERGEQDAASVQAWMRKAS